VQIFPLLVYLLCFATSLLCAILLTRSYLRNRTRLLLWSALCFVGLALSNFFLFIDIVVFPQFDMLALRHLTTLAAITVLIYGFIFESD
jgi:hypothetical protein